MSMKQAVWLVGLALAACATCTRAFDSAAARTFINEIQALNSGISSASAGTEGRLASLFAQNAAAFDYSGPASVAPAQWDEVGESLNNDLGRIMLSKALAILVKNGTTRDLNLAIHVISTYISYPNNPPALPLSSPHACGTKLLELILQFANELLAKEYANLLLGVFRYVVLQPQGPGGYLGSCTPDVGAVLLAVSTLRCPAQGYMVYPINNATSTANITCTPDAEQHEDGANALLGGTLITEMLLSKELLVDTAPDGSKYNTSLRAGARLLSWAVTRLSFAVLQTNSYTDCIRNLVKYEARIPPVTAPPRVINRLDYATTTQGAGVVCSTVAMATFQPGTPIGRQPWDASLAVQTLMNIWLAMGKYMQDPAVNLSNAQRTLLCNTMADVLRFRGARGSVYDMFMPDQYQCVLNAAIRPCPPVGVAAFKPNATWFKKLPDLFPGHDLSSENFACRDFIGARLPK